MLQSTKNKATLSILERLRKQGKPAMSPIGELEEPEMDDIELDYLGTVIRPGTTLPKKKKELAPKSEEAY